MNLASNNFATNGSAGNSTAKAGNSSGAEGPQATDVIGKQEVKTRVSVNPYNVEKCDQILEIEAETIEDLNNFLVKTKKFFTMSMYSVSEFKEKKVTSFEKLISIGAMTNLPSIITGSVSCVEFKSYYRSIVLCMKTPEDANNILKAYKRFMKCRMGDNLRKKPETPKDKIQTILNKACMGLNISFDDTKYKNPVEAEAALNLAIDNTLKNLAANAKQFIIPLNATDAERKNSMGQKLS